MHIVIISEQERGTGFYHCFINRPSFSIVIVQLVCSTHQDTYATQLLSASFLPTVFIKSESHYFSDEHYQLQNSHLVIRIPAVFFKTGYMQSPHEDLNSAQFYHPKNQTLCFILSARKSYYFLGNHSAERASFNLESSPIIAQNTVTYESASHKC